MTEKATWQETLDDLETRARAELRSAEGDAAIQGIRTHYLGRKGLLTAFLREMGNMPPAERPAVGQRENRVKASLEVAVEKALEAELSREKNLRLLREGVDYTLPGRRISLGSKHLAEALKTQGVDVRGVIAPDMIGYWPQGENDQMDILGDPASTTLVDHMANVATALGVGFKK